MVSDLGCLAMDSDEMNMATSNDVAKALAGGNRLNERMRAALQRDFSNKHREREIPLLEPWEYDVIIRHMLFQSGHDW